MFQRPFYSGMLLSKKGKTLSSRGFHSVFSESEALELKVCIVDLAKLGFAPAVNDVREIVTDYVNVNNHDWGKKIFKYKGEKGCAGPDWLNTFMKKQNLSLKNATKLCKARYNAEKNPFIVNHCFHVLEETIKKLGIENRPDLFWNSNESGLPSEPRKSKVISLKGQKTLQIMTGSDRGNSAVLAAVSASGKTVRPLIIFQGKQVQTTWRPTKNANHEFWPWIYSNEKGWTKVDIFHKWFVEWEIKSKTEHDEGVLETRVMIYNGHLSHVNYATICYAREKNVIILKLPPHTIDILHLLDASVFKSSKEKWGNALYKRLIKIRTPLLRSEFSTVLSSDERIERWKQFRKWNNLLAKFVSGYTVTNYVVFCKIGVLPKSHSTMWIPEKEFLISKTVDL